MKLTRTMMAWIRRNKSERCMTRIINMAWLMNDKDLRDASDYLLAVRDAKQRRGHTAASLREGE